MERTPIIKALTDMQVPCPIRLAGWIRTARHSKGGLSFLTINDGSCLANIQVIAEGALPNYQQEVLHLSAGAGIEVTGTLVESPAKGQRVEARAESLQVLGPADAQTYPIQPKKHSYEFLRTVAHLRPRTTTFGAIARVRNEICRSIHEFFQTRGFLYVHTPIITSSDCEGAGQQFRLTTLDPANPPKDQNGQIDFSQDFFARPAYLTVSGQLEAETYAMALSNVYTFGPTFRAENSNTPRHLAEFWMVEPEIAFYDLNALARLAEDFLKHICTSVLDKCPQDMEFFDSNIQPGTIQTVKGIISSDFARISYTEAVEILSKANHSWEFAPRWGSDLQTEHERYLTEQIFSRPVIVTDYPASIKPFYMKLSDDGKTVAAMDVLVPRIGELIGGSQREDRLDILEQRMQQMGLNNNDYWWYLDLRRYGSVPHAGFGLGLERTIQFVTGMANIRDVIPFPRTPRNADF